MKIIKGILLAVLGIVIVIQFVPVQRANPPVSGDLPAPPEIRAILKAACYDCHSHETVWPWYSRVAPVSWLIASDIHEGRKRVNFSTWDKYSEQRRSGILSIAKGQVEEREMPPPQYTCMHPGARLSEDQIKLLTTWLEPPAGKTTP